VKSTLNADDFYVNDDGVQYWSLPGLMFMSELVLEAVKLAGLEVSKTVVRVGDFRYGTDNSVMSIAYPSPRRTIVNSIKVLNSHLCLARRGGEYLDSKGIWEDDWNSTDRIPLADPELVSKLAALIVISLPKKSKYAKAEKK
jgi:hypothetical protein